MTRADLENGIWRLTFIFFLFYINPRILHAGDVDVNLADERGLTPLMWASAYGQVPTVALLLRAGALHTAKGPDGERALHLAAAGGHTDIIRILLAAGAGVNEVDDVTINSYEI